MKGRVPLAISGAAYRPPNSGSMHAIKLTEKTNFLILSKWLGFMILYQTKNKLHVKFPHDGLLLCERSGMVFVSFRGANHRFQSQVVQDKMPLFLAVMVPLRVELKEIINNAVCPFTSGFFSHPSSYPAVHLRPFKNAFHSSQSVADAVAAHHDCHPISSALSLHPSSRSVLVFFCLLVARSVQFWLCYCHPSAGHGRSTCISFRGRIILLPHPDWSLYM